MVGKILLTSGALACIGLGIHASQHGAGQHQAPPGGHVIADAGEMFKRQCASCHIPPDLRFKADQAWLGQIKQTA